MPTLNWIGKEAVVNHHLQVPFQLLKDVPELACGEPGSGNLIVQGDNLVALKALLPYYAGQVKCIYIDPPYNTGNEGWVYNDNVNSPLIREWLGKTVGKEGETLDRHDRWLCMMYPRLALLRQFLREDGLLFVNIGSDEMGHLCLLLDEIFGRQNRIAVAAWETAYTANQTAKHISETADFVYVYAKNFDKPIVGKFERNDEQLAKFKNQDNDPRGPWKAENLSAGKFYSAGQFPISGPTGEIFLPPPGRYWRCNEVQYKLWLEDGRITFGVNGTGRPMLKKYLKELTQGLTPTTWWKHEDFATAKDASIELKEILLGEFTFATPKPVRLLERILQIATNPGDLILDSFAGSGSTGHAVLKLNAQTTANNRTPNAGGQFDLDLTAKNPDIALPQRRFILVEMEPSIARDVTAERVRRVANGYSNIKNQSVEGLGGGFRFCELGEPLFDEDGKIRETVRFADLARHVWFTETGEPLPAGEERQPNPPQSPLVRGEAISATGNIDFSSSPDKGRLGGVCLSPFLGNHRGTGIYLLYNGILGDKSANGGNVLTRAVLAQLPAFDGPKVIYCAGCLLGRDRLQAERIIVRQTPYEVRVS